MTYAGLAVMPTGGIVFAEHAVFPRPNLTRDWMHLKDLPRNVPALITWGPGIALDETRTDKIIRAVWIVGGLVVPLAFAFITLFASPDIDAYEARVDVFYTVAIFATGSHFVTACWGLMRQKAQRRAKNS